MSDHIGHFPQTARQERYGISYLSDVCAEAGVGMIETRPGEDHYAIDAYVHLDKGLVPVQVKCTTKAFTTRAPRHIIWGVEPAWWTKWCENSAPVFILLVHVPSENGQWIDYASDDITQHQTAAYWVEVDKSLATPPPSISVARQQRFTLATLSQWNDIHKRGLGLV